MADRKMRAFFAKDNGRYLSFKDPEEGFTLELSGNAPAGFSWMMSHVNDELVQDFDTDKAHTEQFVITRRFEPSFPDRPNDGGMFYFKVIPKSANIQRKKYYHFKARMGTDWMNDPEEEARYRISIKYV